MADLYQNGANWNEWGRMRECCAAAGWVQKRVAASYRSQAAYFQQRDEQAAEELLAAQQGRAPALVVLPSLQLVLPDALRDEPARLDMCSACAKLLEQVGTWASVAGCPAEPCAAGSMSCWTAAAHDALMCSLVLLLLGIA